MAKEEPKSSKSGIIKYVYLYLVTVITIVMVIISAVGFLKIVLEEYVFDVKGYNELMDPKTYYECSDDTLFYTYDAAGKRVPKVVGKSKEEMEAEKLKCQTETQERYILQDNNELKREIVWYLAMLIVAFPLYLIHWGIIRKEGKKK